MRKQLLNTLMLLAFAGASSAALADDPPAIAGRIALTQGQVSVGSEGGQTETAQVNWPVTTGEMITTARGARTELQVGSTFIRLAGDSSLEVLEMDDGNLRLRLHYGSASIRVTNPDILPGFELSMPEGRVHMQEPGRLRVDAEHVADTSRVSVFDGAAVVESGGASLTVRAGKSAELQGDDVRTVAAMRDGFDDWAQSRDQAAEAPVATRYVSPDMTGYSDLDRYGSWTFDPEYGSLWLPTSVSSGWTPYSDGSWVWLDPWGWTWVDNAPWGYAPFHYGRWVYVSQHWRWAPGHREHHPVWSPALVGWVGGAGWNVGFNFNNRHTPMPARGWFPLSPHDRFVPSYHVRDDHLRRLNSDVRPDTHHRGGNEQRGLTVVPQDQFGHRGQVVVPRLPHASVPPQMVQHAPAATAPAAPPGVRDRDWRREERRGDQRVGERAQQDERRQDERRDERFGRHDGERGDQRVGERGERPGWGVQPNAVMPDRRQPPQPVTVLTAPSQPRSVVPERRPPPQPVAAMSTPPAMPGQPQQPQPVVPEHRPPPQPVTVLSAPPVLPGQQQEQAQPQWRQERRDRFEDERRDHRQPMNAPAPAGVAPMQAQAMPAPPPERFERPRRGEGDFERRREAPPPAAPAPVSVAPPPQARQFQAPPPPAPMAQPAPQQAARPAPAAEAPQHNRGHGSRDDDRGRQQER